MRYARPQAQRNQRKRRLRWAAYGAVIAALLDSPPLRLLHVLTWALWAAAGWLAAWISSARRWH